MSKLDAGTGGSIKALITELKDFLRLVSQDAGNFQWRKRVALELFDKVDKLAAALLTRRDQPGDDSDVRKGLWLNHGCEYATLYGDDGEMQCHTCHVDFKRDGLPHIARMLFALGRLHAGKLPEPATRRDAPQERSK